MEKRTTLVIVGLVCGIIAISGLAIFFLSPRAPSYPGHLTAKISGNITDKDRGIADNFKNGKVTIEILITDGDIDDVLHPNKPLEISLLNYANQWAIPTINLGENSGKTEANYGENIECDGVVAWPDSDEDNLYVKITVPTTSGGDVIPEMRIMIEMWPTDDAVEAVDGTIVPASFDNLSTYDWWNENDTIDVYITGRIDALSLIGFDGAYLIGTEMDE